MKASKEIIDRRINSLVKLKDALEEFQVAWEDSIDDYDTMINFAVKYYPELLVKVRNENGGTASLLALSIFMEFEVELGLKAILDDRAKKEGI